jgi:hypothetical protein
MPENLLLFVSFISILIFFVVGIIFGWVAREYFKNYKETPRLHEEFYDEHNNIIPDTIIAFRFNNDEETDYDSDYYDCEEEDI